MPMSENAKRSQGRRKKTAPTVLDHVIDELGTFNGFRVCTFVAAWAIAQKRSSSETGTFRHSDYADYWNVSGPTVDRELFRFRQVFPMWQRPDGLVRYMQERGEEPGLFGFGRVTWDPSSINWDVPS